MEILRRTFSALSKLTAGSPKSGAAEVASLAISKIDETVGAYDSRIRGVWKYQSKLAGPVKTAFQYSHDMAGNLPEAVECSRRSLSEASALTAMFVNTQHLDEVLHRNSVLPDFFGGDSLADKCHALMCVRRTEREFFGAAMVDDKLNYDVRQVRVNFADHRFQVAAASKEAAQGGARDYFFQAIVGHALREKASMLSDRMKNNVTISRLSLDESLELLTSVLNNPEDVLRMDHSSVAVSRTGIKQEMAVADGNCLNFTLPEIRIGEKSSPEGVMLVSVPRKEVRIARATGHPDLRFV